MEILVNQGIRPDSVSGYNGVGAELKSLRQEQGYSLEDSARTLKISSRYLVAIEEGRFENLPGPAYVVGFLRSYATFLKTDPDSAMERFKSETTYESTPTLDFPVAVKETNIPRKSVVWGSFGFGIAVICGWSLLQESREIEFDEVAEIPGEFSAVQDESKDEITVHVENQSDIINGELKPEGLETGLESIALENTEFELEPSDNGVKDTPIEELLREREADFLDENEFISPEVPADASYDGEEVRPNIIPTPPPPPVESQGGQEPRVYGIENLGSRITLFALQDSWVQVESPSDELLITRILYEGDSYQVPDLVGLTLITGNAGGLKVLVDDKEMPPLGPLGAVRRGILLDPGTMLQIIEGGLE